MQADLRCRNEAGSIFVAGDPKAVAPFLKVGESELNALYDATSNGAVFTVAADKGDEEACIRVFVDEPLPEELLKRSNGARVAGMLQLPTGKLKGAGARDVISVEPGVYETQAIELDWGAKPGDAGSEAAKAASRLGWLLSGIATGAIVLLALPTVGLLFFWVASLFTGSTFGWHIFVTYGPWLAAAWAAAIATFFLPPVRRANAAASRARGAIPLAAVSLHRMPDGRSGVRGYPLGAIFHGADRCVQAAPSAQRVVVETYAHRGTTAFYDPAQIAPQVASSYEAWRASIQAAVDGKHLSAHVREADTTNHVLVLIDQPADPELERRQLGKRATGVLHLKSGRLACGDVEQAGLAWERERTDTPPRELTLAPGGYEATLFEIDWEPDGLGMSRADGLPDLVLYLNRIVDEASARGRAGCLLDPL